MREKLLFVSWATFVIFGLAGCEEEKPAATEIAPVAEVEPKAGSGSSRVQLTVEQSPEHGSYIADLSGRALYLLEVETTGEIACYSGCSRVWRPLIVPQSSPTAADPAVQASLIGAIRRRDGSVQVTYNGHPLYYYVRDVESGQTTGQDVTDAWGEWYLVIPEGRPLENGNNESAD